MELTASSVRCAPAFGSSSYLAFGCVDTKYQTKSFLAQCRSYTSSMLNSFGGLFPTT
jgi:hypothetical protein